MHGHVSRLESIDLNKKIDIISTIFSLEGEGGGQDMCHFLNAWVSLSLIFYPSIVWLKNWAEKIHILNEWQIYPKILKP